MSHTKKDVVENLEQAVRDNEERQRREQMMASTLQKLNADEILSNDDIDNVSKSGIVSVPKASMSIPDSLVTAFTTSSAKPEGADTSEDQASQEQQEPTKPYEETSKVFEAFGNQYWD